MHKQQVYTKNVKFLEFERVLLFFQKKVTNHQLRSVTHTRFQSRFVERIQNTEMSLQIEEKSSIATIATTGAPRRVVVASTARRATISPSPVATASSPVVVTTAIARLSSIILARLAVVSMVALVLPAVVVILAVPRRRVILRRRCAMRWVVRVGHPTTGRWRRSSREVPCTRNRRNPARRHRHGWHSSSRWGHKTGVEMRRKWIWSVGRRIIDTTTSTAAKWRATKRTAGVLRPGLDSLNVRIVQYRWWELDAPEEH